MRLFIAIDLSADIQAENSRLVKELGLREYSGVRIVPSQNIHLTLKFIGDFDDRKIPGLCAAIRESIAEVSPFRITLNSCGVFPPRDNVNVVWTGVSDKAGKLNNLVNQIDETCLLFNIQKEKRSFTPHLTIARVKRECRDSEVIRRKIQLAIPKEITQTVNEIILFASDLRSTGSVYTVVEKFELSAK
ncbi:MAG: RNA 2',3'-cyclic phosphodiesterase [bacterium]